MATLSLEPMVSKRFRSARAKGSMLLLPFMYTITVHSRSGGRAGSGACKVSACFMEERESKAGAAKAEVSSSEESRFSIIVTPLKG